MNIKLSQKLDDGDTALVEEHRDVDEFDVTGIVGEYYRRALSHSYVVSVTVVITL